MRKQKGSAKPRRDLLLRSLAVLGPVVAMLMMLSQPAFAKNTYVITDGSRVLTYSTYATDPAQVLDEAGLELDENDTYTTSADGGTAAITVTRSQDITIEYHGEVMHVSSLGETVQELLTRLNISIGEHDSVSLNLDLDTYDGMELRIEEVLRMDQTYTVTVPYEISYCYDSTLPEGSETILTPGVDGQMRCTATVTYVNGTETDRTLNSESVLSAPVTQIVAIGTAEVNDGPVDPYGMPIISEDTIILPTGEVLTYTGTMTCVATAYCDRGKTATCTDARYGEIAVDPKVIPYGTRMFIMTTDGSYIYGIATAEDTGNPDYIHGNRIDLWYSDYYECIEFGVRTCIVYFLGTEE